MILDGNGDAYRIRPSKRAGYGREICPPSRVSGPYGDFVGPGRTKPRPDGIAVLRGKEMGDDIMKKGTTFVRFTDEEKAEIANAAWQVWNDCAYDLLQAVATERGKDIYKVMIPRSQVIEIAFDAGRTEQILKERMIRARRANRPTVITDDLLARLNQASWRQLTAIGKTVFHDTHYGM